ncbi:hypothetical protein TanjilG_05632 [Lupinus angustifolius]|uniref:DUF4005 domain-containing protein n=1 Tax=Lupinus angustifolius TaxID=3871 RepID=A0A4P1QSI8_LUPAN|nr:PREDICTED: protein IQ-DOMAIN 14 [Lupinus angustifolius]OIV93929.1 hypothetical protein TanjilG_05632 [Lupinus angustifolius]
MGKASKWFRALLGLKKTESSQSSSFSPKNKRRWSFLQPSSTQNDNDTLTSPELPLHHNNHAVAVAAATAAVAEAAVAAAQAAAAVVRLTSSSRCTGSIGIREEWAAVKIQSAFRGCLARKALRALKGLVKLQALVRGHIERKQQAKMRVKRMQAHLQAQARFCAGRAQIMQTPFHSTSISSTCLLHGPGTPDKFETTIRSKSMKYEQSPVLKRNGSRSCGSRSESIVDEQSWSQGRSFIRASCKSEEKSDRILEIDYGKPQLASKRRSLFFTRDSTSLQSGHTSSCEVEETPFCTASNSPQYLSATSKDDGSKRTHFTPTTRSDGSRSYLCGYSDYPSYMAYTESSKAKVRSLSAPKQRPQYDRSSSSNRYSLNGFGDTRLATQKVSALHTGFTNKAYPGSGRLDKLGMPVGYRY